MQGGSSPLVTLSPDLASTQKVPLKESLPAQARAVAEGHRSALQEMPGMPVFGRLLQEQLPLLTAPLSSDVPRGQRQYIRPC